MQLLYIPKLAFEMRAQHSFRHFMITEENGHFTSQRKDPKLALVKTSIHGDELHLDAPDMPTLKVPLRPNKGDVIECE